ncbi:glyoxalase [Sphingomonas sp. Leaf412]|nr:glyoxalase [Sphingomonas sp. Leaf412]
MIGPPSLVPELDVADIALSKTIYRTVFGFDLLIERVEEAFAYLAIGGAHVMMQQVDGPGRRFRTAPMEVPFGRGVNFQIAVRDVDFVHERVLRSGLSIEIGLEERWYRQGDLEQGNRQFVVADPDGYLLRFYQDIGVRPVRVQSDPTA